MSEQNGKTVVICNHSDASHVMPTMIMGASGVGIGDNVILFFCPGGAQALVKGELEKIRDMKLKGLPDPVELYNTILEEGGQIILCELVFVYLDFGYLWVCHYFPPILTARLVLNSTLSRSPVQVGARRAHRSRPHKL